MRAFIFTFFMAYAIFGYGQATDFVKWRASYDKVSSSIIIKATMKDKWVIYSQHTDDDGPIPTEFEFHTTEGVTFEGDVIEVTPPIEIMSEMFGVMVRKFKKEAVFRQEIKNAVAGSSVKGNITFMTCDDTKCLPPETVPFVVNF